jgi:2-polyprenyl-3-methyl-5-hydroxy-6-metoxy-1,4-benzoquinol methylase
LSTLKGEAYNEDLDRYAREYLSPDVARTVDQKVLSMVIDRVIHRLEGPDVLEMGYGDGAWTGRLIEQFGRSHVVDASLQLLERASALYGDKLTVYHSYFEDFAPPALFDAIICAYVLEHVVDPVLVLGRCRNWLKPKGLLFVAVPNATSLHRRLGVVMGLQQDVDELGDSDTSIGHRRVYRAPKMEAHLEAAGFRIETRVPMMFKPLPNSLLAHLSEAQLGGIFDLGDEIPEDQRGILGYFCRPAS